MYLVDRLLGKTNGPRRSSQWPRVRSEYLEKHPRCAACGGTESLEVHHIIPFHIAPDLELEHSNLMTLCRRKKYGIHCHLFIGHKGNYRKVNTLAPAFASIVRDYLGK